MSGGIPPGQTFDALIGHIDYLKRRIAELEADAASRPMVVTAGERADSLQQSEERFRQLAEHIREVFFLSTPDRSRFLYISPGYETLWQRKAADLYEQPSGWLQAVHPEDRPQVELILQRSRINGQHEMEYRVQRSDGSLRWVRDRAYPIRNEAGSIYRMASLIEDITEPKAVEAQIEKLNRQLEANTAAPVRGNTRELESAYRLLRESEQRQRAILDALPETLLRIHRDGAILDIFCPPSGLMLAREQLIDQPLQSLPLAPPAIAEMSAAVADVLAHNRQTRLEFEATGYSGKRASYEATVVRSASDEALISIRDISARKEIERERDRAQTQLQQAHDLLEQRVTERTMELELINQELESFSYSVSHDLRAPLRAIDGFTRILHDEFGKQLPPNAQGYLQKVVESTTRMNLLIDTLLGLSRTARADMQKIEFDLSQLAHGISAELLTGEPQRDVRFDIPAHLRAYGDPSLLRLVLTNLIGNAWKFTRPRSQAEITVGQRVELPDAPYFVRDNGIGFDMAYAGKLFAPFQRLHSVKDFEGTGVGLATVRRIILRHGGRVWAESAVDQGTTIYFVLPGNSSTSK